MITFNELGYYFGELDLIFREFRNHTFMAETDCELLSISKKDFTKNFFHEFKEVGAEIYDNAIKRNVRAEKTYQEAKKYCESLQLPNINRNRVI